MFAPGVYGISKQIASAMRDYLSSKFGDDFEFEFLDELPFENNNILRKLMLKFAPENLVCALVRWKLKQSNIANADRLVIIRGRYLNNLSLDYIFCQLKAEQIGVYFWDTQLNLPYFKEQINYFTRLFTFDPVDAEEFNISYLPLYFPRKFVNTAFNDCDTEIGYYGTFYGRRLEAVKIVSNYAESQKIKFENALFLSPFQYYKNLIKSPTQRAELRTFSKRQPTTPKTVLEACKVVFDYCEPDQRGVSFRLMEAISNGRKIITNNSELQSLMADSTDIIYFDELEDLPQCLAKLPKDFFQTPPTYKIPKDLELNNWIKRFL